jgi:thymidylate synthase ThyX
LSYDVKIIADSVSPVGSRITTYQLRYPRMVHAEFMTHRAISRNASSTRAIPMSKQIQSVKDDPALPVYWGKNQKGMQATEELTEDEREFALVDWIRGRDRAIDAAESMVAVGIHKQIAGRIIEPWSHISVVATATDAGWMNFFSLRCHKHAMPEIQALAVPMARAHRDSTPTRFERDWWHLPYVTTDEMAELCRYRSVAGTDEVASQVAMLRKISVARCARVSYLTHEGVASDTASDVALHDMLEGNGHWSPFEHVAKPHMYADSRSGNLVGWIQYRQTLDRSVHPSFNFATLEQFEGRDFVV